MKVQVKDFTVNRQTRYLMLSIVIIFLWVTGACTSNTKALTSTPLPTSPLVLSEKNANGEAYTVTGTNGGDTVGVFRPSLGTVYLKNANTTGFADIAFNYGLPGDYPVMGDWNGDGIDTIGVYRNGSFYLRNSNTIGFAAMTFAFGAPGDQPVAGDWDGDGVDTIGVYRNGNFLLRNSNTSGVPQLSFALGNPGDIGLAGDWNGDGVDTTGVFRPSNGIIFLKNTNETGLADVALNYGIPGDKPVIGDWDNDGIDTIGVYRNGRFFLRNSNTIGFANIVFDLGNPGDYPVAGLSFITLTQGTTYYVSPSGDDSNPGTQANPWKTIQKAANMVVAGNTVVVQEGDFPERVILKHSGTAGLPITFEAQGTVVMRGFTVTSNYVVIRGFEVTDTPNDDLNGWGISLHGSNCRIEENYIHYATRGGILLFSQPGAETSMANCVVRNNRLYRNSTVGIEVGGRNHLIEENEIWGTIQFHPNWIDQPPTFADADGVRFFGSGHIFRGNYIHDISLNDPENINPHIDGFQTWDGTDVEPGSNCIFERNRIVLSDRDTAGFQLAGGTHNLVIRNNIVKAFAGIRGYKITRSPFTSPSELFVLNNLFIGDLAYAPWPVGITIQDTTNVVIKNNIFLDQPDQVINVLGSSGIDVDYNLAYNSDGSSPTSPIGTSMIHNLWGIDPVFVNLGTGDYHLQLESPAIDAGALLNEVNDDFDGNARPYGKGYDIGAFEYLLVSQPQ